MLALDHARKQVGLNNLAQHHLLNNRKLSTDDLVADQKVEHLKVDAITVHSNADAQIKRQHLLIDLTLSTKRLR
jgi:hypothetical protein